MISSYESNLKGCQVTRWEVENAVTSVCNYLQNDDSRSLKKWRDLPDHQLWYELVACILGSRVSYEIAKSSTDRLVQRGLVNPYDLIREPYKSKKAISFELSKPIFSNGNGKLVKYPFSKVRAHYVVETAIRIYESTTLKQMLEDYGGESEARDNLSQLCLGIGYKQASLFLRNISYSDGLAILDVHVLRYMVYLNLIEEHEVQKISRKNEYLKIEEKFREYARSRQMPLPCMDFAVWVVMRLANKEWIMCQ